eukprot:gnl/MRDRNA2_/MRDRNA2_86263_c0_seq2.p1 gnl/MRDRNA2_/MRDRNA2_86263_c0~~gnl/MRDRNA2_/MRDRNA2_86263_c0_seq2.p1  ORF type:complete len:586 (+),score=44.17 gnl/MRDRNA2_/MRDRNA2_86263_c0_seq2:85-1758(+)
MPRVSIICLMMALVSTKWYVARAVRFTSESCIQSETTSEFEDFTSFIQVALQLKHTLDGSNGSDQASSIQFGTASPLTPFAHKQSNQTPYHQLGAAQGAWVLPSRHPPTNSAPKINLVPQNKDAKAGKSLSLAPLLSLSCGVILSLVTLGVLPWYLCTRHILDAAGPAKHRDATMDHAKWVLCCLVAFSHFTMYYKKDAGYRDYAPEDYDDWCLCCYWFISLFMMPTFCFLSGHFSRGYCLYPIFVGDRKMCIAVEDRKLKDTLLKIGICGLSFQIFDLYILEAIRFFLAGDTHTALTVLADPVGQLYGQFPNASWYLVALFLWRLGTPFLATLRVPIMFSFMVALLPGLSICGETFSRTCGYFPFFVVGLQCSPDMLAKTCGSKLAQLVGTAVMLAFLLILLCFPTLLNYAISLGLAPAEFIGTTLRFRWDMYPVWHPITYYTVTFLFVGLFLSVANFLLSGDWGELLDNMSRRSLYNYLLHFKFAEFVKIFWDWPAYLNSLSHDMQLLFLISFSFGVCIIATSTPLYILLSPVIEPPLSFIFKEESETHIEKGHC